MPKTSAAKAAPKKEGTSKFAQFIKTNKIDTRRLPYFSRQIEGLTPACLELKAKKAAMKAGKLEKDEAILKSKPHSGRPITGAAINKALFGRTLSGPAKTRLVRAVNAARKHKKQAEVGFRDLF